MILFYKAAFSSKMGDAVARKFAMIDKKKIKPNPLEGGGKAAFSFKMGDAVARKFALAPTPPPLSLLRSL